MASYNPLGNHLSSPDVPSLRHCMKRPFRLDFALQILYFKPKESQSCVCFPKVGDGGQAVAPHTRKTRSCKSLLAFHVIGILIGAGATLAWYLLGKEFSLYLDRQILYSWSPEEES